MRHIAFGRKEDWNHLIELAIDRTRFACNFEGLESTNIADYDCAVPLTSADYEILEASAEFRGRKFWLPKPSIVDVCDDKLALNQLLIGGRFAELIPPLYQNCNYRFPFILKKRRDGWGVNSHVIRNTEDVMAVSHLLHSPEYFCQTYISGAQEFALHVLFVNGEVIYAQTVAYEMESDFLIKGKYNPPQKTVFLPENRQIAAFIPVLVDLGYTGTCCIDYRLDNGVAKLLEINPRFGGSLVGDINRYIAAYLRSLEEPTPQI
jgi:glutathione synthase/RimK-type ligase-like ATP-grasp enzyme